MGLGWFELRDLSRSWGGGPKEGGVGTQDGGKRVRSLPPVDTAGLGSCRQSERAAGETEYGSG